MQTRGLLEPMKILGMGIAEGGRKVGCGRGGSVTIGVLEQAHAAHGPFGQALGALADVAQSHLPPQAPLLGFHTSSNTLARYLRVTFAHQAEKHQQPA